LADTAFGGDFENSAVCPPPELCRVVVVAVSLEDYVVVDGLCVINVSLLWTPSMFDVMAAGIQ
jgi:hypothetical protein